jgi:hypothetical protein
MGRVMPKARLIRTQARILALRLRLQLVDLGQIQAWAARAFPGADTLAELNDLRLATRAGQRITQRLLEDLGGPPASADLAEALGELRPDGMAGEDLQRLCERLDPFLAQCERSGDLPPPLRALTDIGQAFPEARAEGPEALHALEQRVRDALRAVGDYTAALNQTSDPPGGELAGPTVAAIVVSYHTGDVLFDCLGVLEADEGIDEIILVDNGNPPQAVTRLSELAASSGKLRMTGGGVNRGFAAGVNLGATAATADRFLILNPDAILAPGSVSALEVAIMHAAEPAIAGGRILGPDGREQRGARRRRLTLRSAVATFLGAVWAGPFRSAAAGLNRNEEPQPAGPVPMEAVSGALMYMTRRGFERLGGFDEGYFMHVEDLDLCRRAEAEGGSVIYTPFASALHHGATSRAPARVVAAYKAAGLNRYFQKFAASPFERACMGLLAPLIRCIVLMRAGRNSP